MDKLVGRRLLDGALPLHGLVLCVSGRLSFELVHEAVRVGAPVLVGVGAPSSLAIELADELGLTLCGSLAAGASTSTRAGGGSRTEGRGPPTEWSAGHAAAVTHSRKREIISGSVVGAPAPWKTAASSSFHKRIQRPSTSISCEANSTSLNAVLARSTRNDQPGLSSVSIVMPNSCSQSPLH
ncbi:MAG: formate dehydrogenase accessory sulfurtransferase FdhD [Solirubrobacteraceae bacterium MAG38_C4-C5]|nr:formate dehydrogenase accessory sulfurtransferase FdhD [Candidatus Siliceabacter maunaloa]